MQAERCARQLIRLTFGVHPEESDVTTESDAYEVVARELLNRFRESFGFDRVEGKQAVPGERSGTDWVIDAKGVAAGDNEAFFIIECRRRTTSRQKQEHLAALAYRILDTGAAGGVIVTPLGIQEGAARVAAAESIVEVVLDADSSPSDFAMQFLGRILVSLSDTVRCTEFIRVVLADTDGNGVGEAVCE